MIQKSLALKVGGGLAVAAGGSTGIYLTHDYYSNILSKYDRALIDYLDKNEESDIKFDVKVDKDGEGKNYTDLLDDSFTFSSDNNKRVITVKVTASTSSTDTFKKGEADDSEGKNKVKNINGGNDLEWRCTINFSNIDSTDSTPSIDKKERLFNGDGKGLFGILKKDYSNDAKNRKKAKEIKAKFIKDCGELRPVSNNKELNSSPQTTITSPLNFNLIKKGNDGKIMIPKKEYESLFDYWFLESYKDGLA